jgi:DNA-binding NarL/FixJ family response regulator
MVTVYCIEGTDMYRDALNRIIASVKGLHALGDSASGRAGLEEATALRPDVVILDSDMPDTNGFEVVKSLRHACMPCTIIMISDHTSPCVRKTAMAAGVDFFLDKFFESQKIGPILETLVRILSVPGEEVPH